MIDQRPHPDIRLVLTDIVMPGMSGRDLAEHVQRVWVAEDRHSVHVGISRGHRGLGRRVELPDAPQAVYPDATGAGGEGRYRVVGRVVQASSFTLTGRTSSRSMNEAVDAAGSVSEGLRRTPASAGWSGTPTFEA